MLVTEISGLCKVSIFVYTPAQYLTFRLYITNDHEIEYSQKVRTVGPYVAMCRVAASTRVLEYYSSSKLLE